MTTATGSEPSPVLGDFDSRKVYGGTGERHKTQKTGVPRSWADAGETEYRFLSPHSHLFQPSVKSIQGETFLTLAHLTSVLRTLERYSTDAVDIKMRGYESICVRGPPNVIIDVDVMIIMAIIPRHHLTRWATSPIRADTQTNASVRTRKPDSGLQICPHPLIFCLCQLQLLLLALLDADPTFWLGPRLKINYQWWS